VALACLFDKAYQAYESDNERFWRLFNLMTLVNGGLLAFAASSQNRMLVRVASVAGFALCIVWLQLQRRYGWWCTWWDEKLADVECQYLGSFKPRPSVAPFSDHWASAQKKSGKSGWSSRKTTFIVPMFFAVAWLVILIFSIFAPAASVSHIPWLDV
jgi:hypothetical protein